MGCYILNPTRLSGKHTKAVFACTRSVPSSVGSLFKRKETWKVLRRGELQIADLDLFPGRKRCGARRGGCVSQRPARGSRLVPHEWPGWGTPGTSRICAALCWHFGFVQFGLKMEVWGWPWMSIVPSILRVPGRSKRYCLPCSSWCACLLS